MLLSYFFFLIFIFLYFFNIGFLTILERKILALLQSRKSVYRISFLNLYHFFLDFFKALGKGVYNLEMLKIQYSCLFIFIFYFLIVLLICFFLPINFYSLYFYYGSLFYLILDSSFVFFKIFLTSIFDFKFSKFSYQKMKKVYLFGESIFLIIIFSILCFFSFMGIFFLENIDGILNLSSLNLFYLFFIFFVFLVILFNILLLKFFRLPFDFLEIETEFVGGLILEFFGIIFTLWMLFEYIFIFNGVLFILVLVSFFYYINFIFFLIFISLLSLFLIVLVFLSKGILVRSRFFSVLFILNKILFFYLMVIFLFILFFFIFKWI